MTLRRRSGRRFGAARHDDLGPFFHFAPAEEHIAPACEAFQAYVGAQAHDPPLKASAGVRLAQAQNVVQPEFKQHR